MKKLTILNSAQLPSPSEIEKFEKEKGLMLPYEYKRFLLEQNPHITSEKIFKKEGKEFWVQAFFP